MGFRFNSEKFKRSTLFMIDKIIFLIFTIIIIGFIQKGNCDNSTNNTIIEDIELNPLTLASLLKNNGTIMKNVKSRHKRSVVHLYDMVVCSTGCNPLAYKGYGCYCGFLGSGFSVDGIDRCCAKHDWCYNHAKCPPFLTYFVPYYWTCSGGRPQCIGDYRGWRGICGTHLCECDRQFAECLKKYPCPRTRAVCVTSPWRFWQNIAMQPPLHSYDYFK